MKYLILAAFSFLLAIPCAQAKNMTVAEAIKKLSPIPTFETYPVRMNTIEKKAKSVNLASHPDARKFRTVLNEGFKSPANFAGHYSIIANGCGTGCAMNWIVDLTTGNVIDMIYSSCGLSFTVNSALLMVDDLEGLDGLTEEDDVPAVCNPAYYALKDGKMSLIKSLAPPQVP